MRIQCFFLLKFCGRAKICTESVVYIPKSASLWNCQSAISSNEYVWVHWCQFCWLNCTCMFISSWIITGDVEMLIQTSFCPNVAIVCVHSLKPSQVLFLSNKVDPNQINAAYTAVCLWEKHVYCFIKVMTFSQKQILRYEDHRFVCTSSVGCVNPLLSWNSQFGPKMSLCVFPCFVLVVYNFI